MKNYSILMAVALLVTVHIYPKAKHEDLTLSQWATECFQKLPEGRDELGARIAKAPMTTLTYDDVENIITTIIEKYRAELLNEKNWHEQPLNKDYYTVDDHGLFQNEDATPFTQKISVPSGSNVGLIGDIHGSITSLLRNLTRLVLLGYMDNNFKFKENFYFISLGDITDRGSYGTECWYTLMLLKLRNWDSVFIVQGNHERTDVNNEYGFTAEFKAKFGKPNIIQPFYKVLPLAVYITSGAKASPSSVQCCHGGIAENYSPTGFLSSDKMFHALSGDPSGFNWGDFMVKPGVTTITCEHRTTKDTLAGNIEDDLKKNKIMAIFRGHQDQCFGLKLFPDADRISKARSFLGTKKLWYQNIEQSDDLKGLLPNSLLIPDQYADAFTKVIETKDSKKEPTEKQKTDYAKIFKAGGFVKSMNAYLESYLWYWKDAMSQSEIQDTEKNGFLLRSQRPVITCTTAIETQLVFCDFFGILTTAESYNQWVFKPFETDLLDACGKTSWYQYDGNSFLKLRNNYVTVDLVKNGSSELSITYQKKSPDKPFADRLFKILENTSFDRSTAKSR